MKKHIFTIAIAALSLSLTSCLKKAKEVYGPETSKVIEAQPFNSIALATPGVIHFTQDSAVSVKVTGPEKLMENLKIEYKDSTVSIGMKDKSSLNKWINLGNSNRTTLHFYITAPDLSEVMIAGSGAFTTDRLEASGPATFTVLGSGDIEIKYLKAPELSVRVAGSGNMDVDKADTEVLDLAIAGSGNMDIDSYNTREADLTITGSGNIDAGLHNAGDVRVDVSGSGNIDLSGDVRSLSKDKRGSGDIDTDELTIRNK